MTANLTGRTALVTGASSGIGLATARALADARAQVVAVARSRQKLDELAAEHDGILPLVADVAEPGSGERIIEAALETAGRLDIVLPNAGVYLGGDLKDSDPSVIEATVATNVTGVFTLVRAALPHLIAQGAGDVLVTSSVAGHQDIHWEPVYSASKHAVQSFVHTVRRQMVGTGVRVGAIAPGVVLNPLWGFQEGSPEEAAKVAEGAGIRSADVADAILYMLGAPAHVTIRDLVILPTNQEI